MKGLRYAALAAMLSAIALATGAAEAAAGNKPATKPVASLTPAKTQKEWRKLVARRTFRTFDTGECKPLRALFYAGTDWLRLATKLAANASPCAQYYVSVPPLVGDKSQPRGDQAWRIRALGPNFHAVAEMNVTGWTNWVTNNASTWYAAGVEARRRMAAAGYDVSAGDTWVVNEFSTAVRIGNGNARANMREFVRGLHDGDGSLPRVKGGVFITGMGQQTGELSVYQARLQDWYEDAAFWQGLSPYVSDWSQELYGDVRAYAVPGATLERRREALNDYLQHQVALAGVAPESAAAARSFLGTTYNPLGNAAWQYDAAFGWTNVPVDLMQHYVSAQVNALRAYGSPRFGFAWSPKNLSAMPSADFTAQTEALLARLGEAIRESAATADAACGGIWCAGDLDGSVFNDGWKTFTAWKPSQLAFATEPQALVAGAASPALTVEQRTHSGLAYTAGVPVPVLLTSSSSAGRFSTSSTGPWSSTLNVTIPNGATSLSFHYVDTAAGTAAITASTAGKTTATQTVTVAAGALARIAVAPASASVATGGTQPFTASGADAHGNAVPLDGVTWTTTAPGTIDAAGVFTAGSTGGSGAVAATSGGVSGSAAVTVIAPATAKVASVSWSAVKRDLRVTLKLVNGSGGAIAGASVGVRIDRDGYAYGSATATTRSDGTATITLYRPRSGCYSAAVTSVSAPGWDGATPANRYCK